MFKPNDVDSLLNSFDLGASTAEKDALLEIARIETQEFSDLYYYDRIDIVKGMKGSGKTALYRLLFFIRDMMIQKQNLYPIFGVEATGDPIFKLYQKEFEDYSEIEFINFWSLYFIVLVYKLIFNAEQLRRQLLDDDIKRIDGLLSNMGLKIVKSGFDFKEAPMSLIDLFRNAKKKVGVETKINPITSLPESFKPILEIEPLAREEISKRPLYLTEFKDLIVEILKKNNIRIWIMLDRLDEIFLHRSVTEKYGLRGLLRAAYNFSDPFLRVKIFLREDILDYLASDGFAAMTHIADRCSSAMSWSKDDILFLITKRLSSIEHVRNFFGFNSERIDRDKSYREEIFYRLFPPKIGKSKTFDWLYSCCSDGNDIVTPRDIIDFFKFAKSVQLKNFRSQPEAQEYLIEEDSFKKALGILSINKKNNFLFAEFNHLKECFLKFENSRVEHDNASLERILGQDCAKRIEELRSIGFLKYIPKSAVYRIPLIWRKGFNIKQGSSVK
ncbi:MAG: hypothetical protein PHO70_02525 [Candidatus Omnitrophica bacterium]|nr:hypothetical protein [Candidatus Omnitrophota bacterium]